ncbi:hypothetical protein C0584_01755 [Candidatus Parcubacteria bacterium]|nr:MAG: hypothetical protein C0584_01755 [Candidatus Parcubacteria bacterium]
MKKILITTENYYPKGGGIEQFVRGLAEFLTKNNNDVSIYTSTINSAHKEETRKEGKIIRSPLMNGSLRDPFSVIKNKRKFADFLIKNNFDYIIANNHNSLAWIKAAKIAKLPIVYICHGVGLIDPFKRKFLMPNDEISRGFPTIKKSLIWLWKENLANWKKVFATIIFFTPYANKINIRKYNTQKNYWLYKKSYKTLLSAKGIIGNSKLTASLFKKENNLWGLPLPINSSNKNIHNHYYKDIDKKFLKKYNLTEKKYLLCTSRINRIKGQEYLVKAIKYLKDDNLKIVFVGSSNLFSGSKEDLGKYGQEIKQIVRQNKLEKRVIFTGMLNFEEMRKIYSGALLTVVPSIWLETFGYVTIESMACETPVIVTKNCGSAECVDKETGFIIDRKNEKQIAACVNSEKNFIQMGIKARRKTLDQYDWNVLGSKYYKILREIYDK